MWWYVFVVYIKVTLGWKGGLNLVALPSVKNVQKIPERKGNQLFEFSINWQSEYSIPRVWVIRACHWESEGRCVLKLCWDGLSIHWNDFWLVKVPASPLRLHSSVFPRMLRLWLAMWMYQLWLWKKSEHEYFRMKAQQPCAYFVGAWLSEAEATWLILPVVICLSQRLSHACLSINFYMVKLRMAH